MGELYKLVSAHRDYIQAHRNFTISTKLDTISPDPYLQLFGKSAYQFLLDNGGVELGNEIIKIVDGMHVYAKKD